MQRAKMGWGEAGDDDLEPRMEMKGSRRDVSSEESDDDEMEPNETNGEKTSNLEKNNNEYDG